MESLGHYNEIERILETKTIKIKINIVLEFTNVGMAELFSLAYKLFIFKTELNSVSLFCVLERCGVCFER